MADKMSVEAQPLLAPAPAPSTKPNNKELRTWKKSLVHVAGEGSAEDVAACCLAWNAPWVAFGWNSSRGLGLTWWKEGLKLLLLTFGLFALLHGGACMLQMRCGPRDMLHADWPTYDGPATDDALEHRMTGMWRDPRPMDDAHGPMLRGQVTPLPVTQAGEAVVRDEEELAFTAIAATAVTSDALVRPEDATTVPEPNRDDHHKKHKDHDEDHEDHEDHHKESKKEKKARKAAEHEAEDADELEEELEVELVQELALDEEPQEAKRAQDEKLPDIPLDDPVIQLDDELIEVFEAKTSQKGPDNHEEDHDDDEDHEEDEDEEDHDDHEHDEDHEDDEDGEDHHDHHHDHDEDEDDDEKPKPSFFDFLFGPDPHGPHGPHPDHDGPRGHHGPHPEDKERMDECLKEVAPALLALVAVALALAMYTVYFMALRRKALRERFGIEGTWRSDLIAWACCSPCALAQETRTMMHNRVEEGLWQGPKEVFITQAPVVVMMGPISADHTKA